jgi:uncharacterized pyridoxamine 5'-phosphate oxidase family protein
MNEVLNFLKENPIQYLATVGLDDKPKVRPFQFMIEDNGKLYFSTSNRKPVYKELQKSPSLELTTSTLDYSWIRITGKANFTDDLKIKQKVLDSSEFLKSMFETADNTNFTVFSIEGKATITGLPGKSRKKYNI